MTRALVSLLLTMALVGTSYTASARRLLAQNPVTFTVIVHSSNSSASLSKTQLKELFLRRQLEWPSGAKVEPVDLAPKLAARRDFSRAILSLSTTAVTSYWMQEIFADGKSPPPVMSTADAVVQFVAQTPGAIGYVPTGTPLDKVRVLTVLP